MGSGLILHTAGQWARKLGVTKASFNRNTLMLSVLSGGAFGMFLFASSTGKEQVYKLHPIFQVGSIPQGELDYAKKVQQAQLLGSSTENEEHGDVDIDKLHSMRAVRRKTMQASLESGKGYSDAHGGHWSNDDVGMDKFKEVQAMRRRTLNDTIQNPHRGLSDSHGGRWSS